MDVTKKNFISVQSDIKKAISESSFLAIDCELTGLRIGQEAIINSYDTQQQYFDKVYSGSKDFLLIQFGLCVFRHDKETNIYKHQDYNFYIFPRMVDHSIPDRTFLCQTSSLEFLISQGFDFNKLFKEGISYLNKNDELKYRNDLEEKRKMRSSNVSQKQSNFTTLSVSPEDQIFVDETLKQIEEFIASEEEELCLPHLNGYQRRLLYQFGREKFGKRVFLETRVMENKNRVFVVSRHTTREDQADKERRLIEKENLTLEEAIGFSSIVQHITESGKLVIGHNMLLDLIHTIDKFLTPLPDTYREFKECASCLFPKILDTKFMARQPPFADLIKSNILRDLVKTLSENPFKIPELEIEDDKQGYSLRDRKEHEAGYDAFITGVCFIGMCQYLGALKGCDNVKPDSLFLKPYVNKLYLMKLQEGPYINLEGLDPSPSRDNVLHISFPREWKFNDIAQLFSPFGSIHIAWIDHCSAYVGLHKREETAVALSTLSQSDTYTVMSYAQHQTLLQNSSNAVPGTSARKRKSSEVAVGSVTLQRKRKSRNFEEYVQLDVASSFAN